MKQRTGNKEQETENREQNRTEASDRRGSLPSTEKEKNARSTSNPHNSPSRSWSKHKVRKEKRKIQRESSTPPKPTVPFPSQRRTRFVKSSSWTSSSICRNNRNKLIPHAPESFSPFAFAISTLTPRPSCLVRTTSPTVPSPSSNHHRPAQQHHKQPANPPPKPSDSPPRPLQNPTEPPTCAWGFRRVWCWLCVLSWCRGSSALVGGVWRSGSVLRLVLGFDWGVVWAV